MTAEITNVIVYIKIAPETPDTKSFFFELFSYYKR